MASLNKEYITTMYPYFLFLPPNLKKITVGYQIIIIFFKGKTFNY